MRSSASLGCTGPAYRWPARPTIGEMQCPAHPDEELVVHIRDGIEVQRCPRCRGLWLDGDEVERLLDLVEARSPEPRIASPDDHERPRKRHGAPARMLEDIFEVFR